MLGDQYMLEQHLQILNQSELSYFVMLYDFMNSVFKYLTECFEILFDYLLIVITNCFADF